MRTLYSGPGEDVDMDGTLHFQSPQANVCSQLPSSSPKMASRPVEMRNASTPPKDQQQQRRGSLLGPTATATVAQQSGPGLLLPDLVAATNNLEAMQLQQQLRNASFEQQSGTTASGNSNKSSGSSGSGGSDHKANLNSSSSSNNYNGSSSGNGHLGVYSPIQRSQTENLNLSQQHADVSLAGDQLEKSGASQTAAAAGPRLGSRSTQAIAQQAVAGPIGQKERDRHAPLIQVVVDLNESASSSNAGAGAYGDERHDSFNSSVSVGELHSQSAAGLFDEQPVVSQSVDLEGAPDAFAPSSFGLGGVGGSGGGQAGGDLNAAGGGTVPEIRKYKKRFNGEVLCASLWGVNLLIGTESGLMFLDRSGQGAQHTHIRVNTCRFCVYEYCCI